MKHLEFIQAVISRLANNSMLMKGWGASVVTALIALGAAKEGGAKLALLSLLPLLVFAYLDTYYLNLERNFRKLYDKVRLSTDEFQFDMELGAVSEKEKLTATFERRTICLYWIALSLAAIFSFCVLVHTK